MRRKMLRRKIKTQKIKTQIIIGFKIEKTTR
jgi:hypothetical protein